jgi:ParB family transcriptional regulator, chromosome partitioning protein
MQLIYLNPRELNEDPESVREELGDVEGLAETIAEQGLLQPLGVVRMSDQRYRVVYGNRRRAAAVKLGLEKVPCILLDAEDKDLLLRQLIENVQRQELNDLEKARAFARLRSRLSEMYSLQNEGELDDAVGKAVGLTGRTVRRYIGLLELPQEVQQFIRRGELNVTQAQHLRRIPNRHTQIELARSAVEEGMSAADLSRLAGYFVANPGLTLETALQALEQGQYIPSKPVIDTGSETIDRLSRSSTVVVESREQDDDDWSDDEESPIIDDGAYLTVSDTIENQPKNKARIFRIRSLDHMVEEADRLSRAYAEGDLVKWLKKDESGTYKLRLLLTQMEQLVRGLRDIASQQEFDQS